MTRNKGDTEAKMVPITLMLDPFRQKQLRAASASTRISMSEFVRISLDNAMTMLKNPELPDRNGLFDFLHFSLKPIDEENVNLIIEKEKTKSVPKKKKN